MKIGTLEERLDRAREYINSGRTWYCARTGPLRERIAEHILREAGFAAFAPIERRWVRVSRHARRRRPRAFHAMPRYVLVGFEGPMPWHRLRALRVTQEIVGWHPSFRRAGELIQPEPIKIPQAVVDSWIEASCEDALARGESLPVGAYRTLDVGQEARVGDGPFIGFTAIIQQIEDDRALTDVQIFGRPTPVWIPLDALDPL